MGNRGSRVPGSSAERDSVTSRQGRAPGTGGTLGTWGESHLRLCWRNPGSEPGTARPGEVPGARLIMGWLLQLMARGRRYNYI